MSTKRDLLQCAGALSLGATGPLVAAEAPSDPNRAIVVDINRALAG